MIFVFKMIGCFLHLLLCFGTLSKAIGVCTYKVCINRWQPRINNQIVPRKETMVNEQPSKIRKESIELISIQ
jgi:hypothetical protein